MIFTKLTTFQIGDRVQITCDLDGQLLVDAIGTVIDLPLFATGFSSATVKVRFDGVDCAYAFYYYSEDIVKILDC